MTDFLLLLVGLRHLIPPSLRIERRALPQGLGVSLRHAASKAACSPTNFPHCVVPPTMTGSPPFVRTRQQSLIGTLATTRPIFAAAWRKRLPRASGVGFLIFQSSL